jgi:hypothetical protein
MQVTVKFGSEQFLRSYHEGITIGEVLADPNLRMVCGYGDNVRALVAGVEQPSSAIAPDGGVILVETRANNKAQWSVALEVRLTRS